MPDSCLSRRVVEGRKGGLALSTGTLPLLPDTEILGESLTCFSPAQSQMVQAWIKPWDEITKLVHNRTHNISVFLLIPPFVHVVWGEGGARAYVINPKENVIFNINLFS